MNDNFLSVITKNYRALFLAYDQGMEHGPADFNDENIDPAKILEIAETGLFTGVIFQKGIAEKYYNPQVHKTPLIIKLNGKTNLVKDKDPYSPLLCTIEEAVKLGAKAVGYTIYVGSEFESQMTKEFAELEQEAHKQNLPLIGWMYPRGKAVAGKENSKEILAYAARLGLELGADIVKLPYTGDIESFKWVVKSAGRCKVVVQGGVKTNQQEFLKFTQDVLTTGVLGLAVGRNIWQDPNPLEIAKQLSEIIFDNNVILESQ